MNKILTKEDREKLMKLAKEQGIISKDAKPLSKEEHLKLVKGKKIVFSEQAKKDIEEMCKVKPKPLKESFLGKAIHPEFIEEDTDIYYLKKDVKSAVEWLKDKLQFFPETMENDFKIIELLDEAFEDVVNKRQGEEDEILPKFG